VLLSIASFLCVVATGALVASVFYYKEPPLRFLVVGDWGREGMYNQSEVAELMARVVGASKFIISTGNVVNATTKVSTNYHNFLSKSIDSGGWANAGDNFYPNGLNSSEDALFSTSFSSVYSQAPLRSIPWYAVLGNHDYGDGFEYCQNDEKTPCHRSPSYQVRFWLYVVGCNWPV
jgi:tartrate-resistant acid phosphatase type 5